MDSVAKAQCLVESTWCCLRTPPSWARAGWAPGRWQCYWGSSCSRRCPAPTWPGTSPGICKTQHITHDNVYYITQYLLLFCTFCCDMTHISHVSTDKYILSTILHNAYCIKGNINLFSTTLTEYTLYWISIPCITPCITTRHVLCVTDNICFMSHDTSCYTISSHNMDYIPAHVLYVTQLHAV